GALGLPMVSGIRQIVATDGRLTFVTSLSGGHLNAKVTVSGERGAFGVSPVGFGSPAASGTQTSVEIIDLSTIDIPTGTSWLGEEPVEQPPMDLADARVIVAGGRALG